MKNCSLKRQIVSAITSRRTYSVIDPGKFVQTGGQTAETEEQGENQRETVLVPRFPWQTAQSSSESEEGEIFRVLRCYKVVQAVSVLFKLMLIISRFTLNEFYLLMLRKLKIAKTFFFFISKCWSPLMVFNYILSTIAMFCLILNVTVQCRSGEYGGDDLDFMISKYAHSSLGSMPITVISPINK